MREISKAGEITQVREALPAAEVRLDMSLFTKIFMHELEEAGLIKPIEASRPKPRADAPILAANDPLWTR